MNGLRGLHIRNGRYRCALHAEQQAIGDRQHAPSTCHGEKGRFENQQRYSYECDGRFPIKVRDTRALQRLFSLLIRMGMPASFNFRRKLPPNASQKTFQLASSFTACSYGMTAGAYHPNAPSCTKTSERDANALWVVERGSVASSFSLLSWNEAVCPVSCPKGEQKPDSSWMICQWKSFCAILSSHKQIGDLIRRQRKNPARLWIKINESRVDEAPDLRRWIVAVVKILSLGPA